MKEGCLHVYTSRNILDILRNTELNCGEHVIEFAMSYNKIFLLIWSINVDIQSTQEGSHAENSTEGTNLFVAR